MATGADKRTVKGQPRAQWAQSMGFTNARKRRNTLSRYSQSSLNTPF